MSFNLASRIDSEGTGGGRYALISIVGPDAAQKARKWAVAVRGVADTEAEIKELATSLQASCNLFDLHAVDMGVFVPLAFKQKKLKHQEYDDPYLQQMMTSFKQAAASGKREFEERKKKLLSNETTRDQLLTSMQALEADLQESIKLKAEMQAKLTEMDANDAIDANQALESKQA